MDEARADTGRDVAGRARLLWGVVIATALLGVTSLIVATLALGRVVDLESDVEGLERIVVDQKALTDDRLSQLVTIRNAVDSLSEDVAGHTSYLTFNEEYRSEVVASYLAAIDTTLFCLSLNWDFVVADRMEEIYTSCYRDVLLDSQGGDTGNIAADPPAHTGD